MLLGLPVVATVDTIVEHLPPADLVPLTIVLTAIWWLGAMHPDVRLRGEQLVIRNPFWTRRLNRSDVLSARPGYFGLVIRRRSGRPCIAWAVQKSNAAEWAGSETRADDAAGCITAWAMVRD
ncbi:hypothetical protein GCM10009630_35850 [Kribbella jejuensis]